MIHFYSSDIVGTVALLSTITSLMSIFFSLGLGSGMKHYISYYMGIRECGKVKDLIVKFLLIGLSLGILSLLTLYLTSPFFAILFFHSLKCLLIVKYLAIRLTFMVLSSFLDGVLKGLQNFKSQAVWNVTGIIITYSLWYCQRYS